ncbi:MAG: hypothetical protein IKU03_02655 [Bacteroidales bacterium]|nr:hypothetical protein [Bacteroidales bacterium]
MSSFFIHDYIYDGTHSLFAASHLVHRGRRLPRRDLSRVHAHPRGEVLVPHAFTPGYQRPQTCGLQLLRISSPTARWQLKIIN